MGRTLKAAPTPSQRRMLDYLLKREIDGDPCPTYREIAAALGWRATGTVDDHVRSLVRKGLLSRSRSYRGLRLTEAGRGVAGDPATCTSRPPERPASLSDEAARALELLSPYFKKRIFPAGTTLWREGEPASLILAIVKGRVRIHRTLPDGNTVTMMVFGPGELFGFLPFLDGRPYPASAEAVEDLEAGTMTREGLFRALRDRTEVALALFRFLGRRLRDSFDRIEILSGHGVFCRVASVMVKLMPEEAAEGTTIVHLPMTSGEFARTLGITPESFSRAVTGLVEMGLLHRLGRGRFQVLDPGSLKRIGSPSGQ